MVDLAIKIKMGNTIMIKEAGVDSTAKPKKNPGLSSSWYIAKKYRNIHAWIADWQWLLQQHNPGRMQENTG